jgi:hypothetical protein
VSEQNGSIESWEELDERLSRLGLHIEAGSVNWVSRIVDYASKIKAERDEAEAKLAKTELHWQSSQRIGEAMYRLHKLKHWLDMDQELFDVMTDQQQADHKYVQTAVDGIIWALKGEKND